MWACPQQACTAIVIIWGACSPSFHTMPIIWEICFASSALCSFRVAYALEKKQYGEVCVRNEVGRAWGMKWDTFMEYCMLNNRLREGVMSLSRKHKLYVLIRRLIINKVQGRCSESKLFHWYLLGQRAPLIGQLKSTLLQSLIGITSFTDFLGTVLPFSLSLALKGQTVFHICSKTTNKAKSGGKKCKTPITFTCQPKGNTSLMEWDSQQVTDRTG